MARELPIRNGRLTTDLDAAGHKIKNLPPGEGFTQAQADWNQSDSTKPDFIKNKPAIPAPMTVDSALSETSENPVQNKVVTEAVNARPTKAEIDAGWWSEWTVEFHTGDEWVGIDDPRVQEEIISASLAYDGDDGWQMTLNLVGGSVRKSSPSADAHDENATQLGFSILGGNDVIRATRHRVAAPVPTKTSDLTNDSGFLTQHQQLTPVYSQTPTFSEWGCTPSTYDGKTLHINHGNGEWALYADSTFLDPPVPGDDTVTNLTFSVYGVTATRTRTDIIGYTLGDQTTKPLQPKGNYLTEHQSLAGLMPMYPMVTATVASGTLTVSPYTGATYTAATTAAAFEIAVGALPAGVTGMMRDCILVIDCTATGAVAPTVTWGTHFHPRTDTATDLAIVEAGKRAVFYISEYASGEFAVGGWVETEGGYTPNGGSGT